MALCRIACQVALMIALLAVGIAADVVDTVRSVTDGDTFRTISGERVRLIGVDCPELHRPHKPVGYFAQEARDFLDLLIGGRRVRLEYAGDSADSTDRYGRHLCYMWVDDSVLVNLVAFQPNSDTGDLKLRRSFVALAWQKGAFDECQRKPESGIGGQGDSP